MTAKDPAAGTANNGGTRRRDITTIEMNAAIAQARKPPRHSIPPVSAEGFKVPEIIGGSREKTGKSLDDTFPEAACVKASGIATRICGAPHCGQNGLPSSIFCPHL